MFLSPFARRRFNKPHATTALENECSSSIREIISDWALAFVQTLLTFTLAY